MNSLITISLISIIFLIRAKAEFNYSDFSYHAEPLDHAGDHSVQTCFTSDNRPALCVDQALCSHLENTTDLLPSNCTESGHVCCPIGNELENRDAFYVPRWDLADWWTSWTTARPNVVHQTPFQAVNVTQGSTSSPSSSQSSPPVSYGCGVRNVNKGTEDKDLGFIVGGAVAQAHSWPWVVAIHSSGRYTCAGALIDKQYVLCAAHCVSHTGRITRAEQIQVLIGAHDRRNSGAMYKVEKIIVHSGYNERVMQNDISMFKLSVPVTYSKTVAPICLPTSPSSCTDNPKLMAYLAGWGTTSAGGMTSNELREVSVPLITIKDCQKAYDSSMVTNKQLCAGYLGVGGKDSCQGDSGGPMAVRSDTKANSYMQCGIVSWGRGCAEARYPGVYTRVSEFLDWIKANKI